MTHKGIHKKIMHHICNLFGYAVINEMIIHFKSYLSQMLMDWASIWVILKLTGVGPKSPANPNPRGSGSDQNPDRKAREPSPDRANNNSLAPGRQLYYISVFNSPFLSFFVFDESCDCMPVQCHHHGDHNHCNFVAN